MNAALPFVAPSLIGRSGQPSIEGCCLKSSLRQYSSNWYKYRRSLSYAKGSARPEDNAALMEARTPPGVTRLRLKEGLCLASAQSPSSKLGGTKATGSPSSPARMGLSHGSFASSSSGTTQSRRGNHPPSSPAKIIPLAWIGRSAASQRWYRDKGASSAVRRDHTSDKVLSCQI
jgi:hypothetical protein